MAEVSRTARVIQNVKVALIFYCLYLVLQFFSRKIFLDYLGAELLGLNTTAQNIIQFLNLAASGMGGAVSYAIYKPLMQGKHKEISEIISIQGWFFRKVAAFVLLSSVVLMFFFPVIFEKALVPLWCVYGTFTVFLTSAMLEYLVNYKAVILVADQRDYKVTAVTQGFRLVKILLQIIFIQVSTNGYLVWLVLEFVFSIVTSLCLNYYVFKEYPWFSLEISRGKVLRNSYPTLLKKTKQLFFHKVSNFVLTQSTPLIIYVYTSLTAVAIYGNYLLIMWGGLAITDMFSRSLNASVGNMIAEGNQEKIKINFWRILTFRLIIASVFCAGVLQLSESFVTIWIGSEYVMSNCPLMILVGIYFIQMSRTCDIFLSAYGLFKDIWAPLIEAMVNVSLSLILGSLWGLSGILFGVLISQILVVNSWKAYFLYKEGFKEPVTEYVLLYSKKILLLALALFLEIFLVNPFINLTVDNFLDWSLNAALIVCLYVMISATLLCILDKSSRKVLLEMFTLLKKAF